MMILRMVGILLVETLVPFCDAEIQTDAGVELWAPCPLFVCLKGLRSGLVRGNIAAWTDETDVPVSVVEILDLPKIKKTNLIISSFFDMK